jgi:hypothetical protein
MGFYVDSAPDAWIEWMPQAPRWLTSAAVVAVVVVETLGFAIPRAATILALRREAADLEDRRHAATLSAEVASRSPASETRHASAPIRLDPRDLLLAVSATARDAGMEIVAVKQSAVDKQGPARRLHLQIRGTFNQTVDFVERVLVAVPEGQVEDMILRRPTTADSRTAPIDLEYVMSLAPIDSAAKGGQAK